MTKKVPESVLAAMAGAAVAGLFAFLQAAAQRQHEREENERRREHELALEKIRAGAKEG